MTHCLFFFQDKYFVLNGNSLIQYSSDDETVSPQSLVFLKNHTVKEIGTPDAYSDDSQKFVFEISPTVGEKWWMSVILCDSDNYDLFYFLFIYYVYWVFHQ